jgi:exopolysaccharide biosynthesis polyprenyl glycosylphosphotransferase
LLSIFHSLTPGVLLDRSLLVVSLPVIVAFLLGLGLCHGVRRLRHEGERVLILGGSPLARTLIKELKVRPHSRYSIIGMLDDLMPDEPAFRPLHLGPLKHLNKIIQEARPDRIIVALAERRRRLPVNQLLVALACNGTLVEDGAEAYERLTKTLAIEALTPSSLLFDKNFQKSRLALTAGHAVSLVASVVGLVCLAPLLGLIALAIKSDSRGPVFFVHERVGMGGKPFKLIKFRTMRAVDRETPLWFSENGNRITRVGKWLRKFRLDELPQFLNVLRGDMNLVGPRPQRIPKFELLNLVARNTPENGDAIPYYLLRSRVRPGITGWAQVRFHYAHNLAEEIEKLRYDLYYVKHMSLWFDLRILLETAKIVFQGRGSSEAATRRNEALEGGPKGMDAVGEPDRAEVNRHLPQDEGYAASLPMAGCDAVMGE